MSFELEPLRTSYLTHVEVGQLMNRLFADLGSIEPELRIDVPYNAYLTDLTALTTNFHKGLLQVQKNAETEKIVLSDRVRDKAVSALGAVLKLYALSNIPEEVEASRCLSLLFGPFKGLSSMNYEAETLAIDRLMADMTSPAYSDYTANLQLDSYISRISDANGNFKQLFTGRMVDTALAETYDMKLLRSELLKKYNDFVQYVLSMAKATNLPLFVTALDLLNNGRKYYNDLLAQPTPPVVEEPVG